MLIDEYGWCHTSGDFNDFTFVNKNVDNHLYNSKDWGFCTRECKLIGNGEAEYGVLRIEENVDILEEKACDQFLNVSLNDMKVSYRLDPKSCVLVRT